ncbi:MAG TPA: hypothetical protein VM802_10785 [Chitinophaga sp.]|uniref:hypothetical protein n=1 Tax=Chitinophaga sp. TaxID=1869181 RepID=UPI002B83DB8A|nr:hypothetical protein [Chitinophaga sp.]HVI45350.1 hypothetical protein [Chitinophaga sp.]
MSYPTTASSPRNQLESVLGGLSFMIIFTAAWMIIGEVTLHGRDHWLIGVTFALIVLSFLVFYVKFYSTAKKLPKESVVGSADEKAKSKRFTTIFIAEGVGILVVKNVLANTGHDNLFIPAVALIVGIHFFPLAKVFNRKFDYYMGAFVCMIAIAGFVLAGNGYPAYVTTSVISIGCAFATSGYGIMMILKGNKILAMMAGESPNELSDN